MKEAIDDYIKEILQRDVKFILNEKKVLRKGKLLLYSMKDYYITFIISTTKCPKKVYEVYYPFEVVNDTKNSQIIFDYSIDKLPNYNVLPTQSISKVASQLARKANNHVFLNNQLRIEYG